METTAMTTTIVAAPPDLTITVTNHRPAPQGSKKYAGHRTNKSTGKAAAVLVEQSKRVKPWRAAVTDAAREALASTGAHEFLEWDALSRACATCGTSQAEHYLCQGAVSVEVTFTVQKAKAAGRRFCWPTTRFSGDIDKLQRATFDAISDAGGIWVDDSRIVEVTARKVHPEEGVDALDQPGAVIRIWSLT
jgi:Holliday junction resolvase RusA-like endonuclease